MTKLPQEFADRIMAQLGDAYGAYQACMEQEGYAGLRANTGKLPADALRARLPFALERVPWTSNGFYYEKEEGVTRHPYYYAGLYYVQEPSAMLPASYLPVEPGDLVLDLCAAPGGKATELSARLKGSGLLVANDASASRAKALVKNLAVWGAENCCITGETPQKLSERFGCCFDKILVDAPCSGEGMFRRDSGLIEAWKERGPEHYAPLQTEILDCAVQMLRPGGVLAYSTCTFAPEEDEGVVAEILRRYPELFLRSPQFLEGFAPGAKPCEACIRIWPHRVKGEGHFLALLEKRGAEHAPENPLRRYTEAELQKNHRSIPPEVRAFLDLLPDRLWSGRVYVQIGEQCLLLPPYHLPGQLRYLRTGILIGTLRRGRFEPAQALAMVLRAADFPCTADFTAEDIRTIRYLKGETLELSSQEAERLAAASGRTGAAAKGWTLVCVDGFGLGWGKYANGSIKNKYYPGWRLQ